MGETQTYTVVLQPEPEGGFTVRVPALPEIVTYGANEEEALRMAKEAAAEVRARSGSRGNSRCRDGCMSPRLPALKARDILRALDKAGFVVVRSKGSHRVCEHIQDASRRTVIPDHGSKDLPRGTVRSIIEQAGLSVEEFLDLL